MTCWNIFSHLSGLVQKHGQSEFILIVFEIGKKLWRGCGESRQPRASTSGLKNSEDGMIHGMKAVKGWETPRWIVGDKPMVIGGGERRYIAGTETESRGLRFRGHTGDRWFP